MEHQIVVECFADTLLTTLLRRQVPQHASGLGEVLNQLEMQYIRQKRKRAVGIIDNDSRKDSKLFLKYSKVVQSDAYIEIRKHEERDYYLIIIKKAHEDFVIRCAKEVEMDSSRFENFMTLESRKKLTKNKSIAKNNKYNYFLNTILQRKAKAFLTIQIFLRQQFGNNI